MVGCDLAQNVDYVINVASIGNTDGNSNTVLPRGTASFIDNLTVADNAVGNRNFDIVTRQNSRTAQANVGNNAALPGVENDKVALLNRARP